MTCTVNKYDQSHGFVAHPRALMVLNCNYRLQTYAKVDRQDEGHIKVKVKYLHPFKFYVAHTFCKRVVCIRLKYYLFYRCLSVHREVPGPGGDAWSRGCLVPGGVPCPWGGAWSQGGCLVLGVCVWRPPSGRLLLWAVRILLECILV